jgi:hypothetical protein
MKGATRKGTEGVKEELFKKSAKQVSQRGVKSISGKALGTTIAGGVASGVVLEGIGVVAEEVLKRTEAMSQEDALSYIGQLIGGDSQSNDVSDILYRAYGEAKKVEMMDVVITTLLIVASLARMRRSTLSMLLPVTGKPLQVGLVSVASSGGSVILKVKGKAYKYGASLLTVGGLSYIASSLLEATEAAFVNSLVQGKYLGDDYYIRDDQDDYLSFPAYALDTIFDVVEGAVDSVEAGLFAARESLDIVEERRDYGRISDATYEKLRRIAKRGDSNGIPTIT